MTNGWVLIWREMFEDKLWLAEPFTRGQAWVDLILLANHTPSSFYIRGNEVKVKRGQVARSEMALAERWQWSRGKVRRCLNIFQHEERIIQAKSKLITMITIIKYDQYQAVQQKSKSSTTDGTTDGTTESTTDGTTGLATKIDKSRENSTTEIGGIRPSTRTRCETETAENGTHTKNDYTKKTKNISTLAKFVSIKEDILAHAKELYPDKDNDKAIADFIESCEIKGYKYQKFDLAYYKWVREDRFNQYGQKSQGRKVSGVEEAVVIKLVSWWSIIGTRETPEEMQGKAERAVKKYGVSSVNRAIEKMNYIPKPNLANFWAEVKK